MRHIDFEATVSRRSLLLTALSTTALLLGRRLLGQIATEQPATGGAADLVIRNARVLDAEAPLSALSAFQTAPEHFFVRAHLGLPAQLPLPWSLTIDGEVGKPVTLSLDEIRRMSAQTRAVTIECAGNGRGLFHLSPTTGVQWVRGGVSTATWTGVPLSALLERAQPRDTAAYFWMGALDRAPLPTVPPFLRSLPRAVVMGDAFVAYEMNGGPIPLLHGGPLRLVVPGWFGMACTKWLTNIHARTTESDNYFMAKGYRYADQSPVTTMRVKSVIAGPLEGARVRGTQLVARGQAWSGAGSGGIRQVDVSSDGGRTWHPARFVGTEQPGAWRTWEADIALTSAGPQSLMARATDRLGAVQPIAAVPNPGGYGNNSIHEVRFNAEQA
jgi:DMSO/TMAO reductase YedYZ molybdopterin-dependent catalytic subunit